MKIQVFRNYSLLAHNSFGLDVKAALFIEYYSVEELKAVLAGQCIEPCLHIGAGSNLLFVKDYEGTILHSCIKGIEVTEENDQFVSVRVGAGVVWDDFVAYCVEQGWYGVENLSLIPGEVGASAVQNIGAYGVEVKDLISSVETVDRLGQEHVLQVNECEYGYRSSIFKHPEMRQTFITYVNFKLSKKEHYVLDYGSLQKEMEQYSKLNLKLLRKHIVDVRKNKLPDTAVLGNAGSFFVNPVVSGEHFESLLNAYPQIPFYRMGSDSVKIPAGWLIEQCAWKGKSLGNAGVYDKQALVLVNKGGATGADIVALSNAIRTSVFNKFGIAIDPEVNFIG